MFVTSASLSIFHTTMHHPEEPRESSTVSSVHPSASCHAMPSTPPARSDTSTPQLAPAQHISNEGSTPSSHAHRLRTQQSYLLLGGLAAVRRLSPPAADLPHLSATAPEVGPRVMQCPCMRPATHAGSWYCAEGPELASDITQWLAAAAAAAVAAVPAAVPSHPAPEPEPPPRAIIGPHAGFAYSGPTAAHAYQHVRPEGIRRVFVLGPSHHVFLRACATSAATSYETPLGELPVDVATTKALQATSQFKVMSPETDGAEHSIGVRGGAACLLPLRLRLRLAGWAAGWGEGGV
jgi:hypothetical protein